MSGAYRIYVLLCSLAGLGLGCLLGFALGGLLGLLAIGPMGALTGFVIAALGRHLFLFILDLMP